MNHLVYKMSEYYKKKKNLKSSKVEFSDLVFVRSSHPTNREKEHVWNFCFKKWLTNQLICKTAVSCFNKILSANWFISKLNPIWKSKYTLCMQLCNCKAQLIVLLFMTAIWSKPILKQTRYFWITENSGDVWLAACVAFHSHRIKCWYVRVMFTVILKIGWRLNILYLVLCLIKSLKYIS